MADSRPLVQLTGATVIGSTPNGLMVLDTQDCANGENLILTIEQATLSGGWRLGVFTSVLLAVILAGLSIRLCLRTCGDTHREPGTSS